MAIFSHILHKIAQKWLYLAKNRPFYAKIAPFMPIIAQNGRLFLINYHEKTSHFP